MDVSFDDINDETLELIWHKLRDMVEAANERDDLIEREAAHLALMAASHELGRRTDEWIAAKAATNETASKAEAIRSGL